MVEKPREGKGDAGCQPSVWLVLVTEQQDETREGGGGVGLITVEMIGNCVSGSLSSL